MAIATEEMLKMDIMRKAWENPTFKQNLLANPKKALKETFGIEVPDHIEIIAAQETKNQFYLIIPENPAQTLKKPNTVNSQW